MNNFGKSETITIDGVDYMIDDLSQGAISQIANVRFSDDRIAELQNELAVANTARSGYLRILNTEPAKGAKSDG